MNLEDEPPGAGVCEVISHEIAVLQLNRHRRDSRQVEHYAILKSRTQDTHLTAHTRTHARLIFGPAASRRFASPNPTALPSPCALDSVPWSAELRMACAGPSRSGSSGVVAKARARRLLTHGAALGRLEDGRVH
eukprot:4041523-Prymnesium_polylepis.1